MKLLLLSIIGGCFGEEERESWPGSDNDMGSAGSRFSGDDVHVVNATCTITTEYHEDHDAPGQTEVKAMYLGGGALILNGNQFTGIEGPTVDDEVDLVTFYTQTEFSDGDVFPNTTVGMSTYTCTAPDTEAVGDGPYFMETINDFRNAKVTNWNLQWWSFWTTWNPTVLEGNIYVMTIVDDNNDAVGLQNLSCAAIDCIFTTSEVDGVGVNLDKWGNFYTDDGIITVDCTNSAFTGQMAWIAVTQQPGQVSVPNLWKSTIVG